MLCRYRAVTSHFFHVKWNFRWKWRELLPTKAAPIASLSFAIIHWSLSQNMTKEQNSMFRIESCAMQLLSSRSKWTTSPRKGRLLRFEQNSTATSDAGAQKLGNNVWYDSESISTKVCSQIGRKWNVTCVWGKGVCSDLNRRLQMAARKSLETMSGMILNQSQPKFAAKLVANEMLCLKAM